MGASKKAECCLNTTNSVPFVRSECEKRKATLEPALTKLRLPTRLISISKYWALPNSCQATVISSLSRNSPAKTSLTDSSTSETLLRSLKRNNSRSYSTTLSKSSAREPGWPWPTLTALPTSVLRWKGNMMIKLTKLIISQLQFRHSSHRIIL